VHISGSRIGRTWVAVRRSPADPPTIITIYTKLTDPGEAPAIRLSRGPSRRCEVRGARRAARTSTALRRVRRRGRARCLEAATSATCTP